MSGESRRSTRAPSSGNIGTIVRTDFTKVESSKFGRVVCILWPVKPALNLAQRAGISERGAQYLIDGKRKPNAKTLLIVSAALLD